MSEPSVLRQVFYNRANVERAERGGGRFRYYFNVKPAGNRFTDGENLWVDATNIDEAVRRLSGRGERPGSLDFYLDNMRKL